jgi:high affinity sulfate transporter 1
VLRRPDGHDEKRTEADNQRRGAAQDHLRSAGSTAGAHDDEVARAFVRPFGTRAARKAVVVPAPSAELRDPTGPVAAADDGSARLPASGPASWLPGVWMLRHYRRAWLARDVGAGLVLTALLVPAGMGYAEASGLPAITGLYATVAALLAYATFGPSRILVLGPDSALAPLIAAVVVAKAHGDPTRAVALASMLGVLAGGMCFLAGLAKGGFITDLLSKPVRVGYMNGLGLTILVAQLPKLFGFPGGPPQLAPAVLAFLRGVTSGLTKPTTLVIGAACLAVILLGRAFAPRVPAILIAVVGATVAVTVLGLEHTVAVGGVLPRGLPTPAIPALHLDDALDLLVAAGGIALVAFADTSVVSRTFAARLGYRVDTNRELMALGAANVAAGLLGGFPVSSSATRTPVAEAAGSRTQLTGIVGALAIIVLLVAAPALLENLPTAALAAVVIAAALRIMDFGALVVFYRVRRSDFVLSLVAFLAVAVLTGIAVAVAVALLDFVRRAWRPHDAVLGRALGVKGYHDLARYHEARQVPGLLLFRWDAPLFFANSETFRLRVMDLIDAADTPVKWVVVAAEPITDVDSTAADMLEELDTALTARGAVLAFAEMKDPVKDRLERYGLQKRIGPSFFFPTLGVAVKAFIDSHGVDWVDWEESPKG